MVCDGECRGRPSGYRVATLTFSAVGTLRKLSGVWIWLVAIGARIMLDRRLEVAGHVALLTRDLHVLPKEWKCRF
jgi:hypothetical protein